MSIPLPFAVAKGIGDNLASGFRQTKDENAIEKILSEAMGSGDPAILQNSIGRILSQVSPERQGPALQYLQGAYSNIQKKQEQSQQSAREREAGLIPGINPTAQAAIYKEKAKGGRLAQYGLNGDPNAPLNQPTAQDGTSPYLSGVPGQQSQQAPLQAPSSVFNKLSKDQLIVASGSPDREISEPAKQQLKRLQQEEIAAKSSFEPESEKLEAKRVSELASEIENDYKSSRDEELRLDRMATLDKEGNVSAPVLIKTLDVFGLPIGILQNPATEEFRKLESDFVRDVSKVFPGGKITNYEIQSYLKTIPSLMNTPEGRKAVIRNRKLLNEAKEVRYNEYKKIIKENSGKKPQNLNLLIEERTQDKINEISDKFKSGIDKEIEKYQQPIRMKDPQGKFVDIPPNKIEAALKAGATF